MKIWFGFASEHSSKIRMIGTFKNAQSASDAVRDLDRLMETAVNTFDFDKFDENPMAWYTDTEVQELLRELRLEHFSSEDLRHLVGEHRVERAPGSNKAVVLWTDEFDLGAFVKYLIRKSAHIEIYSAHDFPERDEKIR
ncbi:MAG: hypothetical protein F4Z38_04890 [Chloroflexi bacterium]|nr:hypothetical protein [Chloroflexota bacterium]MYE94674.1 hypothetical protein [Gemmatimonadota bacterium]